MDIHCIQLKVQINMFLKGYVLIPLLTKMKSVSHQVKNEIQDCLSKYFDVVASLEILYNKTIVNY